MIRLYSFLHVALSGMGCSCSCFGMNGCRRDLGVAITNSHLQLRWKQLFQAAHGQFVLAIPYLQSSAAILRQLMPLAWSEGGGNRLVFMDWDGGYYGQRRHSSRTG
ncbi:hypothetical protein B0T26DRAFT_696899 [Lasiosphaeria miniovina]|uniref:Uncharacterized protein n=1 Tax=Lasiosphaeria miniovina TaxID=1954250 RepID=A0AA40E8P6_9PEZI|nr:uncharacterized protein B0T26DRAFT_696899 [Lasiosphaeria miniovina]KAK0728121.1 hypothetical protein B0T26DRAFT_696899 [Lasiosphaeria miniovina]